MGPLWELDEVMLVKDSPAAPSTQYALKNATFIIKKSKVFEKKIEIREKIFHIECVFFSNCKFSIVTSDFLYFCGFLLLRTASTYT